MIDWSEKIPSLSTSDVKTLLENALKRDPSVADLCKAELERRKPRSVAVKTRNAAQSSGSYVGGFHFVCAKGQGVVANPDGTVWSGTWVVDKVHAKRASSVGAYVALHEEKSERSYLQGQVKDWRAEKRENQYAEGRPVKIENGVAFLIELTSEPHQWVGDGAGEKGYFWVSPKKTAVPSY